MNVCKTGALDTEVNHRNYFIFVLLGHVFIVDS